MHLLFLAGTNNEPTGRFWKNEPNFSWNLKSGPYSLNSPLVDGVRFWRNEPNFASKPSIKQTACHVITEPCRRTPSFVAEFPVK